MRTRASAAMAACLQIAARQVGVLAQHVLDLLSDLRIGLQGGARALEDHRHFAPAQFAHRPGRAADRCRCRPS